MEQLNQWACQLGFPEGSVVKTPPANARDVRDAGSTFGSGRSLGEGNGNTLQYSCLEKFHGPEKPGGLQFIGHKDKESDTAEHAYSRWTGS